MTQLSIKSRVVLLLGLLPIFIALLTYSVTWAFISDEGFHLVAAQSIAAGQRPYIDFCFPQTPLNAYINAGILLLFGDNNWRAVHIFAALYLCLTTWLVADFVQSRLPDERWRTPCAFAAAVFFGLNAVVVQFGPAGQAYAIGMLFGTAAFRASIRPAYSRLPVFAWLAGIFAGGAAASTLLTAPVAAILLIWFLFFQRSGARMINAVGYLLGCGIPFLPVFWLYSQGPQQTLFNVFRYQAAYRGTNWGDANMHDLDALTDWLDSPEALILLVLFAAASIYIFKSRGPNLTPFQREFVLAATLGIALVLFISTAHPTFERYFCEAVPFLAIMATLGLYAVGVRLATPRHAWLTCGLMIALGTAMFLRSLFDQKDDEHWSDYEEIAKQVTEVTPLKANLYADELTFFLLERRPPQGLEFSYAEKLELSPQLENLYHIVSVSQLKKQLAAGHFATFQTCRQSVMDDLEPDKYFRQHTEPADCDLFWQPKGDTAAKH